MSNPSPAITPATARALVLDVLADIAPDLDPAAVDPDARLQADLELDSMDYLNFVVALSEQTGLDIPEADYPELASVGQCALYLTRRATAA